MVIYLAQKIGPRGGLILTGLNDALPFVRLSGLDELDQSIRQDGEFTDVTDLIALVKGGLCILFADVLHIVAIEHVIVEAIGILRRKRRHDMLLKGVFV